jgi:K+-sensing histidine kinase KdpD
MLTRDGEVTSPVWGQRPADDCEAARKNRIQRIGLRYRRWSFWLVPTVHVGCLAAFVADLTSTHTLAFGVFYVPLVATAVFHRAPHAVWVLCAIACAMVIIGSFSPDSDPNTFAAVCNRALSICAVLATAVLVRHARSIEDQLATQTRRAEAAEHFKSRVLTGLSQEILTQLYLMIAGLALVTDNGRHGDRAAALGMARTAARHLISTVDNLVDLSQFQDRPMQTEPIDLGVLLRRTAETSSLDANARQIRLIFDVTPDTATLVDANPWAVRRILENLIADAINHTTPGGEVAIRTAAERDHVSALISDNGTRPPSAFNVVSDPGIERLTPPAMGLSLSRRLARAIDAELTISGGLSEGTTARLMLRRVPRPDRDGAGSARP